MYQPMDPPPEVPEAATASWVWTTVATAAQTQAHSPQLDPTDIVVDCKHTNASAVSLPQLAQPTHHSTTASAGFLVGSWLGM
jgi:hypothetical protein